MNRRRIRFPAWLALVAIIFAQMATATYACPLVYGLLAPAATVEMATPCADMAREPAVDASALCVEHCKVGQQLVDTHPSVDQGASTPALFFLTAAFHPEALIEASAIEPPCTRATSLPVLASSSRLRI